VFDAGTDENSVVFTKGHLAEFVAIKNYVEQRIAQGAMGGGTAAALPPDVADQIRKLGALRDDGLLSDEEFAQQKAKLLG
jgi:hypothetical protein